MGFYWRNERSRPKRSSFSTSLEGFKAYLKYPSFSNAKEERVFSIVRKNETCFWPRLDPEETVASIVTVKLATESGSVETFNIPQVVLTAAKSATYKYKLSSLGLNKFF